MISIEVEFPTNSASPVKRSKVSWRDGTDQKSIEDLICSAVGLPKPDHYQIKLQNIRGGVKIACSNKLPSGQVFRVVQVPREGMEFEFEMQQREQFAPPQYPKRKKSVEDTTSATSNETEEVKEDNEMKLKVKTPVKSKVPLKSPSKNTPTLKSASPSKPGSPTLGPVEPTSPILNLLNKSREKNKEYISRVHSESSTIIEEDEDGDDDDDSKSKSSLTSSIRTSITSSPPSKKKIMVSANICPILPTMQRQHYLSLEHALTVSFNEGNISQDVYHRLTVALKKASERHMDVYKQESKNLGKESKKNIKKDSIAAQGSKEQNDEEEEENEEEEDEEKKEESHISAELRELALLEGERMASTMMIEVEKEAKEQLQAMKDGVYFKTKEEQEAKERALAMKIEKVKERIHRENEEEEQSLKEREEQAAKAQKEKQDAEIKARKETERKAADLAIAKLNQKLKAEKEESKLQLLKRKESARLENDERRELEKKKKQEEEELARKIKLEEEELKKKRELEKKINDEVKKKEQIRFAEVLAREKAERERLGLDSTDHHANLEMTDEMRLKINKARQLSRSASIKSLSKTARPNSSSGGGKGTEDDIDPATNTKKLTFTPPTFVRKRSNREVKHVSEKKKVVPMAKILTQRVQSSESWESNTNSLSRPRGSSMASETSERSSLSENDDTIPAAGVVDGERRGDEVALEKAFQTNGLEEEEDDDEEEEREVLKLYEEEEEGESD